MKSKEHMPYALLTRYVVLLHKSATWSPEPTSEVRAVQEQHLAYLQSLIERGKALATGPFLDDGYYRGMVILTAESLEEAKELANADPAVKSGRLLTEVRPWGVVAGVFTNEARAT